MSEARLTAALEGPDRKKRMTGGPPLADAPLTSPVSAPTPQAPQRPGRCRSLKPKKSMPVRTSTTVLMTAVIGAAGTEAKQYAPGGVPKATPSARWRRAFQSASL